MAHARRLRAEIRWCQRRARLLEAVLAVRPEAGAASDRLVALRARIEATWARLLDAELKA
ncbi:MAG: hypothetical protein QOE90_2264 [Thermoplasmata archaeon]|jgi:hypothetical protein|nr:hypothetical protein [Thermoplasmata archaeon]